MAYNGWANYATWNVALWLQNDEGLHEIMRGYKTYDNLIQALREELDLTETPDQVAWNDSNIDHSEINAMMAEHRGGG